MTGLAIRDLSIEYASGDYVVRPISDLNVDVASGELALLLGASGCGKTTLLGAVAAIQKPARGSILVGSTEVTTLEGTALSEYRRTTVGLVFQDFNLLASLTALENVQVPLWAGGQRGKEPKQKAEALLEQVGLADRMHHKPGDMSGGQQQRVAIARALANDPPVVLADEPTAHLDFVQVDSVIRLLRELAQPGRLVVVATHDDRLLPLADQVVELSPRPSATVHEPGPVELAPGEVLFEQGDVGDLIYEVQSGEIEIVRLKTDGTYETLATLGEGGYFGELAPMFRLPRAATARAGPNGARLIGSLPGAFRTRATTR